MERVIGDTLATAKRHLREIQCKVGTVRYAYDPAEEGVVISQNPKPFWRRQHGAVNLVIGKGKRGS